MKQDWFTKVKFHKVREHIRSKAERIRSSFRSGGLEFLT